MKVYVLTWYDDPGWDVEGVTSNKELAKNWMKSSKYNNYRTHDLLKTEEDYDKWLKEWLD